MAAYLVCPTAADWPVIARFLAQCGEGAIVLSPRAQAQLRRVTPSAAAVNGALIEYDFGGQPDLVLDVCSSLRNSYAGPVLRQQLREWATPPRADPPLAAAGAGPVQQAQRRERTIMKLETPLCPECGSAAIGTVDTIPGVALFSEPDASGNVYWREETELEWNGQTTQEQDGLPLVQCRNGHAWPCRITEETA